MYNQLYEYIEKFLNQLVQRILRFQEKITGTLNKHAPKKIKTFWGNQKPDVNETLRKAIMKRWQLKNNAKKPRNVTDGSHYKRQRNYIVRL